MSRKSRRSCEDAIIGHGHNESLAGSNRLPVTGLVIKRISYLRSESPLKPRRDICRDVYGELKEVWDKACIPTRVDKSCIDLLLKLFEEWNDLKRTSKSRRETDRYKARREDFRNRLVSLFDLSPSDVRDRMKAGRAAYWQEDYEFLTNQRKIPQVGCMASVDRVTAKKEAQKQERMEDRAAS